MIACAFEGLKLKTVPKRICRRPSGAYVLEVGASVSVPLEMRVATPRNDARHFLNARIYQDEGGGLLMMAVSRLPDWNGGKDTTGEERSRESNVLISLIHSSIESGHIDIGLLLVRGLGLVSEGCHCKRELSQGANRYEVSAASLLAAATMRLLLGVSLAAAVLLPWVTLYGAPILFDLFWHP